MVINSPSISQDGDERPKLHRLLTNLMAHDHHARVRSPGIDGGRGFSRLSSRQPSFAESQGRPRSLSRNESSLSEDEESEHSRDYMDQHPDYESDYESRSDFSRSISRVSSVASMVENEVLNIGETIGLGADLEHLGGIVRDCFASIEGFNDGDDGLYDHHQAQGQKSSVQTPASEKRHLWPSDSTTSLLSHSFLASPSRHTNLLAPSLSRTSLHTDLTNSTESITMQPLSNSRTLSPSASSTSLKLPVYKRGPKGPLKVLSKLGAGSYAVVYLVQEVLYDPALHANDNDVHAGIGLVPPEPVYGQKYALKCLCKKDLTDEMLAVQRGEVILQSSLPEHDLIVQLYGALETDHWLFLILEYCPGQDLYFWLESSIRESGSIDDAHWPERSETTQSTFSLDYDTENDDFTPYAATSDAIPIRKDDADSMDHHLRGPSGVNRSFHHIPGDHDDDNSDFDADENEGPATLRPTGYLSMSTKDHGGVPTGVLNSSMGAPPLDGTHQHGIYGDQALNFHGEKMNQSHLLQKINGTSMDNEFSTPRSPRLLQEPKSLDRRRRLRLISRMFSQMCEAVAVCHELNISHRDIKPENFIVTTHMQSSSSSSSSGVSTSQHIKPQSVVVKITDWGLGTQNTICYDCDCGSKPYMAYECRNNLRDSYEPQHADIWSLGIVLLNMLYLRNPWADPTLNDPDFSRFVKNPIPFLLEQFPEMTYPVASYLANNVFCNILEDDGGQTRTPQALQLLGLASAGVEWAKIPKSGPRRRVSAAAFGKWASSLITMLTVRDDTRDDQHVDNACHLFDDLSVADDTETPFQEDMAFYSKGPTNAPPSAPFLWSNDYSFSQSSDQISLGHDVGYTFN